MISGAFNACSSSVGNGQLTKMTVPTGVKLRVEPNATVLSVPIEER